MNTETERNTGQSPTPATMRAVAQRGYGDADVLSVETVETPVIEPDEVLLEVHAAGIDRGTWHLMTGTPYLVRAMLGLRGPKQPIPGLDVAGRVVAVGSDVTRFAPGDEVFGVAKGSLAEYAAAKEEKLAVKPSEIAFDQAAVVSISGMTALQALTDVGKVEAGQHVLVIGASGGVGTYAVQLAKALGAEVTGVASAGKLDMVRSIGADHVVDYTTTDYLNGDTRYDLILDIGGRSSVRRLRRALAPRGTVVFVGGEGGGRITGGMGRQLWGLALSPFVRQRLTMFLSREHHSFMERLGTHLESGDVTPVIGGRFSLEEVGDAMARLAAGKASGKLAIVVRKEEG